MFYLEQMSYDILCSCSMYIAYERYRISLKMKSNALIIEHKSLVRLVKYFMVEQCHNYDW